MRIYFFCCHNSYILYFFIHISFVCIENERDCNICKQNIAKHHHKGHCLVFIEYIRMLIMRVHFFVYGWVRCSALYPNVTHTHFSIQFLLSYHSYMLLMHRHRRQHMSIHGGVSRRDEYNAHEHIAMMCSALCVFIYFLLFLFLRKKKNENGVCSAKWQYFPTVMHIRRWIIIICSINGMSCGTV